MKTQASISFFLFSLITMLTASQFVGACHGAQQSKRALIEKITEKIPTAKLGQALMIGSLIRLEAAQESKTAEEALLALSVEPKVSEAKKSLLAALKIC